MNYKVLVLHGGQDPTDWEYTIDDFKKGVWKIMIATSVAAWGLDIKDIWLVVNYNCPNHMEDYVHWIGRTGWAGNPGTSYTFISTEEAHYAEDLICALKNSNKEVPPDLQRLDREYKEKIEKGEAKRKFKPSISTGRGIDHFSGKELWKEEEKKKDLAKGYIDEDIDDLEKE